MILDIKTLNPEVRDLNLERKKRRCLQCDRSFMTTRVTRICGRCHKIIDKQTF